MTQVKFDKINFPIKTPILKDLSASIQSNKLTAIIGPSGSGKTTLIKIISGRFTNKYTGTVTYDSRQLKKQEMRHKSVFVHQDDIFLPYLTVEETITFYETLRNKKHVDNLELERIMSDYVGTSEKGISAGERKRLSILIGMIDSADIIFLDEPTSGLDSLNALTMIRILKSLAGTKICVIHQPSAEMFFMFDEIIVMQDGSILYQDKPENVFKWFDQLQLECPKYSNPADYIFTHVLPYFKGKQVETYSKNTEEEMSLNEIHDDVKTTGKSSFQVSWLQEFRILLGRNAKSVMRDKMVGFARATQSLVTALIIGMVYNGTYKMNLFSKGKNIIGIMYIFSSNILYASAISSIPGLFASQNIFKREYQSKYYRYSSFFIAKVLSDDTCLNFINVLILVPTVCYMCSYNNGISGYLTILLSSILTMLVGHSLAILASTLSPSILVANAVLPAFMMPLTLLNGMFVDTETVPAFLKILKYISPTRYCLNIMMKSEFESFPPDYPRDPIVGWEISIGQSYCILLLIYLFNDIVSYFLMRRKVMKSP